MTTIVISSGHGKKIRGARGNPVPPQLDEVDQARRVVERVAEFYRSAGVTVITFHDDISTSQNENLNRIVNFHNSKSRDLDISTHFNAFDHSAHGTEVLYVSQQSLAKKVCDAICAAGGFTNRGAKLRSDLFFLNNTNKPAILLETCFCDHTGDSNAYNAHFDAICKAIAESSSGAVAPPGGTPPPVGERPPPGPEAPTDVPLSERPEIGRGDEGSDVVDLQRLLPHFSGAVDGDFGSITEGAVMDYQATRGLCVDGICGAQTWGALYENKEPMPLPSYALTRHEQDVVTAIARDSAIARYSWRDRGVAPTGYTQGFAVAFAQCYRKLLHNHPAAIDMARARTSSDKDALHLYKSDFERLGMPNEHSGPDTLRHLFALMLGHGMRESSGKHCEGRDQSADNVSSDTAEAGLYQTSYNARSASNPEFDDLMNEFAASPAACYLDVFAEGVSCSSSSWGCYGSGAGYQFQKLCKECPPFAVETCGLTLRSLCNHYGPIIRHETELKADADRMLQEVQDFIDSTEAVVA